MSKQIKNTNEAVRRLIEILDDNPNINAQALNYKNLRTGSISIGDFFVIQLKLDNEMKNDSKAVGWKKLKKNNIDTYYHEKKHEKSWRKYGVKTELFNWKKHPLSYFILDLNFTEIVENKGLDAMKIVEIYKDMMSSSFKNEKTITNAHIIDVFFFEILNGLDDFNKASLTHSFKKYLWIL
jgi:hypothetical protein